LGEARVQQRQLIAKLGIETVQAGLIVGCEPSCVFTLKDELCDLAGDDVDTQKRSSFISASVRMVDELLVQAIDEGDLVLDPNATAAGRRILFHGHCHQKAASATTGSIALLQRIPGATVDVLDAGCCGMAGSFGFEREHYDLSLTIGGMRLFPAVNATPVDTIIAATGVSCRQQIRHGTGRHAVHPVTLIRDSVKAPEHQPRT
jgi:Fe-S oxidoreductase